MKRTLWTKNFTLVTAASALGAIGGIAGGFALSFLVFDETGSTFASALVLAIQLIPYFIIPLILAPWMDRMPRKPFLVGGDLLNGMLYGLAGIYLMSGEFSYVGYLGFSLLLSSLGAFDELAYNSFYPKLIPEGMEEKGYTVSAMLYPVMKVVMTPLSAILFERFGVAWLLILQAALSFIAAAVESRIKIQEQRRMDGEKFSIRLWWKDICEAAEYLKQEAGAVQYLRLYGSDKRGGKRLFAAVDRLFPNGAWVKCCHVFAAFCGRIFGAEPGRHRAVPYEAVRQKEVWICFWGVSVL